MIIDKELRVFIRQQVPILDKEKKFIFIPHNKVAQRSVTRDLLKGRVLVRKDDINTYDTYWKNLTNKELSKMFVFTIIRNPYDRYVSAFFYFQGKSMLRVINNNADFTEWTLSKFKEWGLDFNPHFERQVSRIYYKGKLIVDFVARLENIKEDWKVIAKKIGCKDILSIFGFSKRDKDYKVYYNDETKKLISEVYEEDIRVLGYTYI